MPELGFGGRRAPPRTGASPVAGLARPDIRFLLVFASRLWPLVLVAALGVVPIGPQEHVHETIDEAGHVALLVHRHVQLHGVEASRGTGHETVDHPDPITVAPNGAYTAPALYVLHPPAIQSTSLPTMPPVRVAACVARACAPLIHAPPRAPSSLRAPPSVPA